MSNGRSASDPAHLLEEEFEKFLNTLYVQRVAFEDATQYVAHMMRKAYLAGREKGYTEGCSDERRRCVEIARAKIKCRSHDGKRTWEREQKPEEIANAIERQEGI